MIAAHRKISEVLECGKPSDYEKNISFVQERSWSTSAATFRDETAVRDRDTAQTTGRAAPGIGPGRRPDPSPSVPLDDESGYDEETWPKLKKVLDQERRGSPSLFHD